MKPGLDRRVANAGGAVLLAILVCVGAGLGVVLGAMQADTASVEVVRGLTDSVASRLGPDGGLPAWEYVKIRCQVMNDEAAAQDVLPADVVLPEPCRRVIAQYVLEGFVLIRVDSEALGPGDLYLSHFLKRPMPGS